MKKIMILLLLTLLCIFSFGGEINLDIQKITSKEVTLPNQRTFDLNDESLSDEIKELLRKIIEEDVKAVSIRKNNKVPRNLLEAEVFSIYVKENFEFKKLKDKVIIDGGELSNEFLLALYDSTKGNLLDLYRIESGSRMVEPRNYSFDISSFRYEVDSNPGSFPGYGFRGMQEGHLQFLEDAVGTGTYARADGRLGTFDNVSWTCEDSNGEIIDDGMTAPGGALVASNLELVDADVIIVELGIFQESSPAEIRLIFDSEDPNADLDNEELTFKYYDANEVLLQVVVINLSVRFGDSSPLIGLEITGEDGGDIELDFGTIVDGEGATETVNILVTSDSNLVVGEGDGVTFELENNIVDLITEGSEKVLKVNLTEPEDDPNDLDAGIPTMYTISAEIEPGENVLEPGSTSADFEGETTIIVEFDSYFPEE